MKLSVKPRSILQLTITGFLAVAGLLIAALIVTANQLDDLSDQSQRVVNQSVTAMRASRILIEQTSGLERNIRQYSITRDENILDVYAERRTTFIGAARQLENLNFDDEIPGFLDSLLSNEARAWHAITGLRVTNDVVNLYPGMLDAAYAISRGVDSWTNTQLASIRRETAQTRDLLTVQAIILVSAALIAAAIFTALITRPLMQVNRAIHQLGSGAYATPVAISGPKDLVSLGERLDWLRSRLDKLERQRSSFLRHVSHELKTPLAAIQESSALLGDGIVGELTSEQREIVRIQSSNCQRLQALINDLLRYNSDSFSVLNLMPQPLRLDTLVEGVLAAQKLALKARRLAITQTLEKITVQGDPEQLRVVLDNLLSNAIRFSPEGGSIDLRLYHNHNEVLFEIIDNGPGVSADEAEKIFDAFYQGKAPDNAVYKGSGLGLAIAEEYAKANNGTIEAVSSSAGGHFRLRFATGMRMAGMAAMADRKATNEKAEKA